MKKSTARRAARSKPNQFEKQLKLLAQTYLENVRFDMDDSYYGVIGYVGLDRKRPFGNQDVANDILTLIGSTKQGREMCDDDEPCWSSGQIDYANMLMAALPQYLQIKFAKGKHARTWEGAVGKKCPLCVESTLIPGKKSCSER